MSSISIQAFNGQFGLTSSELRTSLTNFVTVVLGLLSLVALFTLMIGAIRWAVSGSNEEFKDQAQAMISGSIISQIIIILAWAIIVFVVSTVQPS